MRQSNKKEWSHPRSPALCRPNANEMLDVLLALDSMLVEVSMQLYNVPRRDRSTVRKQSRRLHAAVRQHLPRLLKPSVSQR